VKTPIRKRFQLVLSEIFMKFYTCNIVQYFYWYILYTFFFDLAENQRIDFDTENDQSVKCQTHYDVTDKKTITSVLKVKTYRYAS
jgi:hypothetical protein